MVKRWDNGKEVDTTDNGRQLPPTMDDNHHRQWTTIITATCEEVGWSSGEEEEQW